MRRLDSRKVLSGILFVLLSPQGFESSPEPERLWEQMLSPENLGRALRRVRANRGAPGADGMTTEELVPWLREHWVQRN
jgi:retron-type reverse transcriptase